MSQETWTHEALFEGLDVAPGLAARCRRLGLLRVVGRDARGRDLYGPDAREQLEQILELIQTGYAPKDIAVIARRLSGPKPRRRFLRRPPVFLDLDTLSERSGVATDRLRSWSETGALVVAHTTSGGQVLFTAQAVERARRLDDLLRLGVDGADVAAWGMMEAHLKRLDADPELKDSEAERARLVRARALLDVVAGRLDGLRGVVRRWDRQLAVHRKVLARLDRSARGDDAPKARRRRGARKKRKTQVGD